MKSYNSIDFSNSNILVIGDLMLDKYMHGDVSRISPEAPVPVVKVINEEFRVGGAGNVAINLASIGAKVSLIAIVGDDEESKKLETILTSCGVSCLLEKDKSVNTQTKLRILSKNQQLLRLDFEEEFHSKNIEHVYLKLIDAIDSHDAVIFSDYGKGTLLNIEKYIEYTKAKNKLIFVDPKGIDFKKYRGASYITPNITEFEQVVGVCKTEDDIAQNALKLIREVGVDNILLTRGEKGMTLFTHDEKILHQDTKAKSVYDVTGAGDTVIATFAASLVSKYSIEESIKLSNVAAGIVVGKIGTASTSKNEMINNINPSSNNKTIDEIQLKEIIKNNRRKGLKTVMTNGCFDILHTGHTRYLNEAKNLGYQLVVAVNTDSSIKKLKGSSRPINSLNTRMEMLSQLSSVDWVISFDDETPEKIYSLVLPDILVKAGDYNIEDIAGADCVLENGGEVKIAEYFDGDSTSAIINKILNLGEK